MKYLLPLTIAAFVAAPLLSQQTSRELDIAQQKSMDDACTKIVFVESPVADTYVAVEDSTTHGLERHMRLRGQPAKKARQALLRYKIHHIDPNYVRSCTLKLYTVSRRTDCRLMLFQGTEDFDEHGLHWFDRPATGREIASQRLSDRPFTEFDVTDYVRGRLSQGDIRFSVQTDSRKPIDISSRESGLGSELIISVCTPVDQDLLAGKHTSPDQPCGVRVLPSRIPGKFTVELMGVPAGGFGDLMLMDEVGNIIRQVPLAIQEGDLLYHTLDFGDLPPGPYHALFRKGRVMIRDQFRLKPSADHAFQLEVELVAAPTH